MLSLAELRRAARILDQGFEGHVIERWVQPDAEQLAFTLYGRSEGLGRKVHLLLSARPELARISALDALPKAPQSPPGFVSYLRAHLSRARLLSARIVGDDRQLALRFSAKSGEYDLLLSLLGNRSNVYLCKGDGVLVASLRPLSKTRDELALGRPYAGPEGALPRAGEDRFEDVSDPDFLAAVERHYSPVEGEREEADLTRDLRQLLRKEAKAARRRVERIEEELAEADQATVLQKQGELLKSVVSRIAQGDEAVTVDDYETGEPVTIALDPAKSPKENLDALFKRYQKLLRRLTKAGGQIDQAREWLGKVEGFQEQLALCTEEGDAEALAALAARPEIASLLDKQRRAAGGRARVQPQDEKKLPARFRDLPRKLHPRRYRSRDGLEIWVGRSDEGNDYLTTRLARGNDLFFHLDGAPGSHVILRTEGNANPPQESVLDACELSVHFSKQKNASRADVHVVPIKQVKKPKGAKRGLVWVTGGKSIHLRREEARLERLLEGRID